MIARLSKPADPTMLRAIIMTRPMTRSLWHSAWALLAAANLFWAGNIVLARAIAGHIPPVTLAYWRWTGAFVVAVGFAWPRMKADLPVMLRHWKVMLLLAATGIASYNTMSYIGLTSTTALNVLLLQSASPLIIIVWAYALFRETPTPRQAAGVWSHWLASRRLRRMGRLSNWRICISIMATCGCWWRC